ncbi:MAG: ABC transporter ATP-binding protein [Deltaproteobacteria bacterium]|nr:MAG: ABC transporter ATP-binding protein [Deltaproteobacteria bacterium]
MLLIDHLSKGYGSQVLFDDISFKINSRERIGLVGRNGHGKTTLLRLITGQEEADKGQIVIPKHYRIGYVEQMIRFTAPTILDEGMNGLCAQDAGQAWKVEKVLAGLGFSEADMGKPPESFSGGFQVRLNLAKVLVSEPDLLLLDEPTNYLDIMSIRWIQRFLVSWPREVLLITHDRGFMDAVITHTVGIHRQKIRKVAGNTGKYYAQIEMDETVYEKTRQNDERKKKEMEQFITRFRAKARLAGLVQSRIKALEKMDIGDKLETLQALEFCFRSRPFPAKQVGRVSRLSFGYTPELQLVRTFSLSIQAGDRICIIGKNGRGKTTLLKLLAGSLQPDAGEVVYHSEVVKGLYEQTHVQTLVDRRSVEEEIRMSHPDVDYQRARQISGLMMFPGDAALKRISVLSGGEKSRVMLGKLLATPVNLLLLDEPTNHLDMDSCDALLAALDAFDGTLVMVTHNEGFLHTLANRLVVFTENGPMVFDGTYAAFLEKIGWEEGDEGVSRRREAVSVTLQPASVTTDGDSGGRNRKAYRKRRSDILSRRSAAVKKFEKDQQQTESEIESLEATLISLNTGMLEASQDGAGDRIADLAKAIRICQDEIDALYEKLESVSEAYESAKAPFDRELAALEQIGAAGATGGAV